MPMSFEPFHPMQAIAARIPGAIFQLSAIANQYQIDYISDRILDLIGVSAAEITTDFQAWIAQIKEVEHFFNSLKKAIEEAIDWNYEGQIYQPNGEIRWIQISAKLAEADRSKIIFCGIIFDITKHKQIELGLRKSRQKLTTKLSNQVTKLQQNQNLLQRIIDNTNASVFVKEYRDTDGTYILINREFAHRFNIEQNCDRAKTDYDLFPIEIATAFRAADREALASGTPIQLEEIEPREDGFCTSIVVKFPLFDEQGEAFAIGGIATDITDLKRAKQLLEATKEELERRVAERTAELSRKNQDLEATLIRLNQAQTQLIQSEKMSSLGQLVAGIAHEINNPVNFIHGNLQHAENYAQDLITLIQLYQKHDRASEIQALLDEIDFDFLMRDTPKVFDSMRTGTHRIQSIVQSLRSFSRLDEAELKTVDLHEGIEQTLTLLQYRLKSHKVTKHYGTVQPIQCYAGQLNQVWMNLINNAIDAVETAEHRTIEIHTQQYPDQSVEVRIRDTGLGISEEIRSRIFDPFFTTKPVGKGTGMGLAICYQTIVKQHHGSIECFSVPHKGTEFVIKIPNFW